jgi:hypothetical protein
MEERTKRVFVTLRAAIDNWSVRCGHQDAYVRNSQARRDLAEMIYRYCKMYGRRAFIDRLEVSLREASSNGSLA